MWADRNDPDVDARQAAGPAEPEVFRNKAFQAERHSEAGRRERRRNKAVDQLHADTDWGRLGQDARRRGPGGNGEGQIWDFSSEGKGVERQGGDCQTGERIGEMIGVVLEGRVGFCPAVFFRFLVEM